MSPDGCVALPHGAMGLSAVFDCGISWSYSLTIYDCKKTVGCWKSLLLHSPIGKSFYIMHFIEQFIVENPYNHLASGNIDIYIYIYIYILHGTKLCWKSQILHEPFNFNHSCWWINPIMYLHNVIILNIGMKEFGAKWLLWEQLPP